MPRNTAKKDESINRIVSEVTLDDFANAAACNGSRLSKGLSFRAGSEALRAGEDGWSWHDEEPEDGNAVGASLPSTSADALAKGDKDPCSHGEEDGTIYPTDVWSLLSNFIGPCDVSSFAGICRGARRIIKTRGFWRRLYLRYYAKDKQLPGDLQLHMLERPGGLMARVVRALHLLYEPLVARSVRLALPATAEQCRRLEGLHCIAAWYTVADELRNGEPSQPRRHIDRTWRYCFKLGRLPIRRGPSTADGAPSKDCIQHNPEAGYLVLIASSNHFMLLPQLCGLALCSAKLIDGLLAAHADRKLKLVFGTVSPQRGASILDQTPVQIEPATECHIYPWWHPNYPAFG